jgi:hypothetical protein
MEIDREDRVSKRRCLNHLQALADDSTQNSTPSTPQPSITLPETAIEQPQLAFSTSVPAEEEEGLISRQSRCGRRVKLPTRYK